MRRAGMLSSATVVTALGARPTVVVLHGSHDSRSVFWHQLGRHYSGAYRECSTFQNDRYSANLTSQSDGQFERVQHFFDLLCGQAIMKSIIVLR